MQNANNVDNQNTSRVFCIINLKQQQKHLECSY